MINTLRPRVKGGKIRNFREVSENLDFNTIGTPTRTINLDFQKVDLKTGYPVGH